MQKGLDPFSVSHNTHNMTDVTLVKDDSEQGSIDSDIHVKRRHSVHRKNSIFNDESFKRLPLDESFKRLPLDEGFASTRRLPVPEEQKRSLSKKGLGCSEEGNDSCKRLPSMTRRNSVLEESCEIKRQSSVSRDDSRSSTTIKKNKDGLIANTSGNDLLRLTSITRRNSVSSDAPTLGRKNSLLGGLLKVMRWTEEPESERERRAVKTWDDFKEKYRMGAPVGQGTQGQVLRGTRIADSLPVVIKILEEHAIKPWNAIGKMPVSAYLLRMLNNPDEGHENPYFLKYVDHFHVDKSWVLVTEYEEHEWIDLSDLLLQRKVPMSEQECMTIFANAARALCDLHAVGFTHNDIKGAVMSDSND